MASSTAPVGWMESGRPAQERGRARRRGCGKRPPRRAPVLTEENPPARDYNEKAWSQLPRPAAAGLLGGFSALREADPHDRQHRASQPTAVHGGSRTGTAPRGQLTGPA